MNDEYHTVVFRVTDRKKFMDMLHRFLCNMLPETDPKYEALEGVKVVGAHMGNLIWELRDVEEEILRTSLERIDEA